MTPFKVIIVLGKSGSGKGTQAEMLAKEHSFKIISSGSLLRARAEQNDFVGKGIAEILDRGGLIPTPIIFHLWLHELENAREANLPAQTGSGVSGIIFEGSPRKLYEAYLLQEALEFYQLAGNMQVLHLDILDAEALKRLLARGRHDDKENQIRERLRWYKDEVMPAVLYYKEKGNLIEINGEQPVEEVYREITEKLKDFLGK
ncbi:MAG: hypothetical protein A3J30_02340 [Candidatus Wildermuthbacteria bacterium RIFCSPLOWO2_02_FULL_47_9c]|uniref:Adenylate kinase n=2 Tax=Parcubacteria group TaxID=1794811 RepID=A0A837ILP8_9BACT|nr:MAG: Adenylate kinase [Candidatus Yanofskybacteria bacterium GW2011_GWC1_48_11]KKW04576.1 MAG: Adenylate kinase [Parcubacteria group bacterium GW2011_GWB1_49_12]KKW09166.1 MAG: Adenylate kinase [Parcubacteria group bacterium GW2011_GWA1_49_26]KKW13499.1 MAG: Adenylate kinase [Parcubacteria group bacterium GW2011_GWA2_50_10]OHA61419.1 MAG: hypothetical protein A2109_00875 [Candidatus Wildermuthbacteria bacterium GWA1_49_26]OHA66238.1 MAG: hypothetical protein A2674_02160 [Candidatus Wildermu